MFQSLFYWITYSYYFNSCDFGGFMDCFNPYFIGLPILIMNVLFIFTGTVPRFQSLFYWITYSYNWSHNLILPSYDCFNPYFIGLPILII